MIAEATRDGLALDAPAPDGPATASRATRRPKRSLREGGLEGAVAVVRLHTDLAVLGHAPGHEVELAVAGGGACRHGVGAAVGGVDGVVPGGWDRSGIESHYRS